MKIIPQILEFFFWVYLFEIECTLSGEKDKELLRSYSNLIEEVSNLFHQVVAERCSEGFISFGKSSITVSRNSADVVTLKIEFEKRKEVKTYIKALEKYRDCDIRDYVNLDNSDPSSIRWVLKSKDLTWQASESALKAVEIKIRVG